MLYLPVKGQFPLTMYRPGGYHRGMDNTQFTPFEIRIDAIMRRRCLNVEELAALSGLSRPTIYALRDRKASGVQFETLNKLCRALSLQPGDLFEPRVEVEVRQA